MDAIKNFIDKYLVGLSLPSITIIDIVEMIIIAFAIYEIIIWVKSTRAKMLVKGIFFLLAFSILAMILQMDVILWIFKNAINVGIIAVIIVFQPELRSALEQLGRKNVFAGIFSFDDDNRESKLSEASVNALVRATFEMAKCKTGALIVIENDVILKDIERSGISIDGELTSQLLINIFEHNTPLHDGAVIIRDNRVLAATCYLPLSDNLELSKDLGTRHRAAVGVSEVSDSFTIVVSEETGTVSVAWQGGLIRDLNADSLRMRIQSMSRGNRTGRKRGLKSRKGRINRDEPEEE